MTNLQLIVGLVGMFVCFLIGCVMGCLFCDRDA